MSVGGFPIQTRSIAQVEREAARDAEQIGKAYLIHVAGAFAAQLEERLQTVRVELNAMGYACAPEDILHELQQRMDAGDDPLDMAAAAALIWAMSSGWR